MIRQGQQLPGPSSLPRGRTLLVAVVLVLYGLLHIFTLSRHPFVHSDEAWLAVLTRAMMEMRSPAATEEVFRLIPRYPHVLKTLYHLLQMPFIGVSWTPAAARLPSLAAGGFSLWILTLIAGRYGLRGFWSRVPSVLLALDPQFWYASHLGRQEMVLTALFLTSWYLKKRGDGPIRVAMPLAASVFVHPNGFITALAVGVLYLPDLAVRRSERENRRKTVREFLLFGVFLGAAALLAVAASFLMDGRFLEHYRAFGDSVGAGDRFTVKLLGLPAFLGRMWRGEAGTYYLPELRPQLVLGAIGVLLTFLSVFSGRGRTALSILTVPAALMAGMVIIGKFAAPSVILLAAPLYLIFGCSLAGWAGDVPGGPGDDSSSTAAVIRRGCYVAVVAAALVLAAFTWKDVSDSRHRRSYNSYTRFLEEQVGASGRVLANLNTAFAFSYDRLVIWRDLEYLADGPDALDRFLRDNGVEWVVLPDEMGFIYESRPVWNRLYGNPRWYPELLEILEDRGTETARGLFPEYAMRIVPLMGLRDWELRVFRLHE